MNEEKEVHRWTSFHIGKVVTKKHDLNLGVEITMYDENTMKEYTVLIYTHKGTTYVTEREEL